MIEETTIKGLKKSILPVLRLELVQLAIIVSLSVVLRTIYILSTPWLGYDESAYLYLARQISQGKTAYSDFTLFTSPLYVYVLSGFQYVFGNGEFQVRFFSALMGGINTLGVYLIGKELKGKRLGGLSSIIYSISSFIIHMDGNDVIETLLTTILVVSVYTLMRGVKTKRSRHFFLLGILTAIAFFTKTTALFTIISILLMVLLWKGWKTFFISFITLIVASLVLFFPFFLNNFRLSILNILGYSLVRRQGSMGLQDSIMHIIWWHGDLVFVALSIISSFFILSQCYNYIRKNLTLDITTLLRKKEGILLVPPLFYFCSLAFVNFWFPYLLYPVFVFLTIAVGYFLDHIINKILNLEVDFERDIIKIEDVRKTLFLILLIIFMGAIAIEANSVALTVNSATYNRNNLGTLIDYFKSSTVEGETVFSTDPSASLQLGEKLTLPKEPFLGIDILNNVRFESYYHHVINYSILDALLFKEDLDFIEANSYDITLFPLLKKSKYILMEPVFINNAPQYHQVIDDWLRQNTVPINLNQTWIGMSRVYRVLPKGENVTLWDGLNNPWIKVKTTTVKTEDEQLTIHLDLISPDYDVWVFNLENASIITKNDVYFKIKYKTEPKNYVDGDCSFHFVLELANGTERSTYRTTYLDGTDGYFKESYFSFLDLLKSYGYGEDTKINKIYISLPKWRFTSISFSEFKIFEITAGEIAKEYLK